jgi:hypothetical protein
VAVGVTIAAVLGLLYAGCAVGLGSDRQNNDRVGPLVATGRFR